MYLDIYSKSSKTIKSDLTNKNVVNLFYQKYEAQYLAVNNPDQDNSVSLTRGHKSTNDVILAFHTIDDNILITADNKVGKESEATGFYKDSCFIKSRFTLFSCD